MKSQNNRFQAVFVVIIFAAILAAIYYFTLLFNTDYVSNWFAYIVLLFIEVYILTQTIGAWWAMLYADEDQRTPEYYKLKSKVAREDYVDGRVAVFITVYGEDPELVEKTIRNAVNMRIKHDTYILDDGKDKRIKKIARKYNAEYVTRPDNRDKKAGNLNYSLKNIDHEFVAFFDADYVPHKNFLLETLPFFHDKKLALVQTPQYYRNRDNFISRGSGDIQRIFYDIILNGKNRFNAVFWVGTNSLFRRKALESVGWVEKHSSEDIMTAYKLHQNGWKTVYYGKVLAKGIAPNKLKAYYDQQVRWAGGGFDLFFRKNPMFAKGLIFDQRLHYFLASTFYFSGFAVLFLMLMPVLYFLFGWKPLDVGGEIWAIHYIPFFLFQFVVILLIQKRLTMDSFMLALNTFPAYVISFFTSIFGQRLNWTVTGSSEIQGKRSDILKYLYGNIVLLVLIVFSIPVGLISMREVPTTLIYLFWSIVNIFFISSFIWNSLHLNYEEKIIDTK